MKNLFTGLCFLMSLNAMASDSLVLDVCHSRDVIIDGLNSGIHIIVKSEHESKDYYSNIVCYKNGSSYVELNTRESHPLYKTKISISDELCEATRDGMNSELDLVRYALKGRSAFRLVIENNVVVSTEKTKMKCRDL